ncbi:MAG: hypothetical protein H6718_22915 [Polyangiaceae bacterium]|nr:hypothetical protein [Polyangiaceae bacterium]
MGSLLVLCVVASPAWAAEERAQALQELYLAEPAYLQEHGEVQLTLRADALRAPELTAGSASAGLEYGISDNLQAELSVPYLVATDSRETQHGVGQLGIGALAGGPLSQDVLLTGGLEVTFPSPSTLAEDQFGVEPSVIVQAAVGDLHVACSGSIETDPALPFEETEGTLATAIFGPLGPAVPGAVVPTLEIARVFAEESTWSLASGFRWAPSAAVEVGAALLLVTPDTSDRLDYGAALVVSLEHNFLEEYADD